MYFWESYSLQSKELSYEACIDPANFDAEVTIAFSLALVILFFRCFLLVWLGQSYCYYF